MASPHERRLEALARGRATKAANRKKQEEEAQADQPILLQDANVNKETEESSMESQDELIEPNRLFDHVPISSLRLPEKRPRPELWKRYDPEFLGWFNEHTRDPEPPTKRAKKNNKPVPEVTPEPKVDLPVDPTLSSRAVSFLAQHGIGVFIFILSAIVTSQQPRNFQPPITPQRASIYHR